MPNEPRRRSDQDEPPMAEDRTGPLPDVIEDRIRGRAYELYETRGADHGRDMDDWLQAERELRPTREGE